MRPYVIINMAMSADGKIASRLRKQLRISGDTDFERVDKLKASVDAVLVGIGTILSDDPSLTVKSPERRAERVARGNTENPMRVIVDSKARTPVEAEILHRGKGERLIATTEKAPMDRVNNLKSINDVEIRTFGREKVQLVQLMEYLYQKGIRRMLVEGGGELNWSLFVEGLVDEFIVFTAPFVIGGRSAPTPIDGEGFEEYGVKLELTETEIMDGGVVLHWKIIG